MPTARQLVASRCPECSAPVDLKQVPREVDQIRCAYCGTPLLLPKRATASAPPVYRPPVTPPAFTQTRIAGRPRPPIVVDTEPRKSKGNAGCGILVSILIFLVMVASDVGVFRTLENALGDGSINPAEIIGRLGSNWAPAMFVGHLYATPLPVLSTQGETVDTVLLITRDSEDRGEVISFNPQERSLRWRAGPFSRNFLEIVLVAGPRYIYVGDQGRLTALDRETGEQVWQISLANQLPMPCEGCLQYMAGYVIALTRDGTLQSFEGSSGLPAWSRRLNSTPRLLYNVGGQPGFIDANERNHATFYMLDRISGTEFQAIQPVCQIDGREIFATPHLPFIVSADGLRLHVLGSGSSACAWRFNLVTGATEWVFQNPREVPVLPFSWTNESYLIRDGVLYTSQRHASEGIVRAADSQSGTVRELYRAPQYELELELMVGDTLVVKATPNFARNEPELWGIDRASGARRWQVQLELAHPFDSLWLTATPAGIFAGQCLWEDRVCLFEVLDPDSGVSGGQTRQSVGGSVSGVRHLGNRLWMNVWGKLYALDTATATVEFVWP